MGFVRAAAKARFGRFALLAFACGSLGLAATVVSGEAGQTESRRLTPGEEAKTFILAPGLKITLVADGSMVREPLAAQFGADGRLWVLELGPLSPGASGDEPG